MRAPKILRAGCSMLMGALAMLGCGAAPSELELPSTPKEPLRGGIAEFTPTLFDGETLEGRVLVGATSMAFVLDARLVEYIDIEFRNIRACGTGERLGSYIFDLMVPPARDDQKVRLEPGYWYGANVNFHLFDRRRMKVLPQCFEAELWVWSLDRRLIVKHPILVRRTDKPAGAPAEGVGASGGS